MTRRDASVTRNRGEFGHLGSVSTMNLSDVRLLSFDCYGTLIDWERGICDTVTRLAGSHGVQPERSRILSLFASHETHVQNANPTWTYPMILAETWRRMATSLGMNDTASVGAVLETDARAFAASVPEWPAFPDSHDALIDLQSRCKLVILSNVDNESFAGTSATLDVTFDAILTAQDIGSYKPDPRNFHALLSKARELGVAPEHHLHVAQSLFHDHVPAKAVGLQTVWINRYATARSGGATPAAAPVTPDWEFPTLRAFADALVAG